jgi:hypothetical protein
VQSEVCLWQIEPLPYYVRMAHMGLYSCCCDDAQLDEELDALPSKVLLFVPVLVLGVAHSQKACC